MLEQLVEQLKQVSDEADRLIAAARTVDELRQAESRLMSKQGALGTLLSSIGRLSADQRGPAGKEINLAKKAITERFTAARARAEHAADRQVAAKSKTFNPEKLK